MKTKFSDFYIQKILGVHFEASDTEVEDIAFIKGQLDKLGIKYELSNDKFRPFKAIYKPINKSDDFYKKFNDLVQLNNLGSFVKTDIDSL